MGRARILDVILNYFKINKNKIISKEKLLKDIWKVEYNPNLNEDYVSVAIHRIRKNLKNYESIKTVYGGYVYNIYADKGYFLNEFYKLKNINNFNIYKFNKIEKNKINLLLNKAINDLKLIGDKNGKK